MPVQMADGTAARCRDIDVKRILYLSVQNKASGVITGQAHTQQASRAECYSFSVMQATLD